MSFRITLLAGLLSLACSSGANPIFQRATGSSGSSGSNGADAAGGSNILKDSGSDGGGGASGAATRDALADVETPQDARVEAADAREDARADASGDSRDDVRGDARADAAAPPPFIVVVGSSTAAGFGLSDPSTSWAARYTAYLMTQLPGAKLTNLAVSGYTSFEVQPTGTVNPAGRPAVDPAHNITAALALHPDAVIVNLPSNDAAANVPVDVTIDNLKTVASKAAAANVLIWITTSQPRKLMPAGIELLLGVRDRVKLVFGDHALDFFTPLAAPDGTPLPMYNQGDGIHPNAEGHRLLFEQVRMADLPSSIAKSKSDGGP
jgi:lysophospholipase L1-like esterase